MTKYAIEDGLQIPAPNTGGRPEDGNEESVISRQLKTNALPPTL